MSQSCACSLFLAKTNEKDACFSVPQSSSPPQSCAKEKSSGVEIALLWFSRAAQAYEFKVDRLQMIVVAKNLSVLQLFISRMPKMCAILQLVSAPLNPIPIAEHFRRSHPQCEHSCGQHIFMSKETNAK